MMEDKEKKVNENNSINIPVSPKVLITIFAVIATLITIAAILLFFANYFFISGPSTLEGKYVNQRTGKYLQFKPNEYWFSSTGETGGYEIDKNEVTLTLSNTRRTGVYRIEGNKLTRKNDETDVYIKE